MENDETTPGTKPRFTEEELLALALEDAVASSDHFARKPVLARAGKGYSKSAGVEGLKEEIAHLKSLESPEQTR